RTSKIAVFIQIIIQCTYFRVKPRFWMTIMVKTFQTKLIVAPIANNIIILAKNVCVFFLYNIWLKIVFPVIDELVVFSLSFHHNTHPRLFYISLANFMYENHLAQTNYP